MDDCIEEYDVFILDYFATSTVLAMLMDKPVIFLDIGLRRLAAEFLSTLKERCHYVSIDINGNLDDQLYEAMASWDIRVYAAVSVLRKPASNSTP